MQANRTGWMRWLPGLNTLRRYEWSWLRHDLVAGLVMTTMPVPVGIAFAEASGVPGINGLYAISSSDQKRAATMFTKRIFTMVIPGKIIA